MLFCAGAAIAMAACGGSSSKSASPTAGASAAVTSIATIVGDGSLAPPAVAGLSGDEVTRARDLALGDARLIAALNGAPHSINGIQLWNQQGRKIGAGIFIRVSPTKTVDYTWTAIRDVSPGFTDPTAVARGYEEYPMPLHTIDLENVIVLVDLRDNHVAAVRAHPNGLNTPTAGN
jgi:hypothetical protein